MAEMKSLCLNCKLDDHKSPIYDQVMFDLWFCRVYMDHCVKIGHGNTCKLIVESVPEEYYVCLIFVYVHVAEGLCLPQRETLNLCFA